MKPNWHKTHFSVLFTVLLLAMPPAVQHIVYTIAAVSLSWGSLYPGGTSYVGYPSNNLWEQGELTVCGKLPGLPNSEVHKDLAWVEILGEYVWHFTLCKERRCVLSEARTRLSAEAERPEEELFWGSACLHLRQGLGRTQGDGFAGSS